MIEFLQQMYIPIIAHTLLRGLTIFVISLGFVYIAGRMLELIMSNKGRNSLALFVMIPASYISVAVYDTDILVHPYEIYWRTVLYVCISAIFFVTIGWRLFDRVDNFLDNKFSSDRGEVIPKVKKIKKTTKNK